MTTATSSGLEAEPSLANLVEPTVDNVQQESSGSGLNRETPRDLDGVISPAPWALPMSPGVVKKTRPRAVHTLHRDDSLRDNKVLMVTEMRRSDSVIHPELFQYHDHFEFMEVVGKTQYSEVFKVRHRISGELFAIKRSRRRFKSKLQRERCLREIRAVAALPQHENIVAQYRAWQESGHFYIQMDYCEGGSLQQLIQLTDKSGRTLDDEQIIAVAQDIASGLDFLHTHNVMHLDIKPENIYRSRLGPWKIGDFGLAVAKETKDWEEGDGDYVAPELLRSHAEPTTAADIFSLGATLYECATGNKLPRLEGSPDADLKELPGRQPTLQQLLAWMLDANPGSRPTAAEILTKLRGGDMVSPGGLVPSPTERQQDAITPPSAHTFTFDIANQQQDGSTKVGTTPTLPVGLAVALPGGENSDKRIIFGPHSEQQPGRWAPSLSPLVSEGALTPGAAAGLIGLTPPTGNNENVVVNAGTKQQQQQQLPQQSQHGKAVSRRLPPLELPSQGLHNNGADTGRTAGSNSFRLRRRDTLVSPSSDCLGSASESEEYTLSCGTGGTASDLEFVDILQPTSPGSARPPLSAERGLRSGTQNQNLRPVIPRLPQCPAAPSLAWDLHTSPEMLAQQHGSPGVYYNNNHSKESSPVSGGISARSVGSVRRFPTLDSLPSMQQPESARGKPPAGPAVPRLQIGGLATAHRKKRQLSSRRALVQALRDGEALASSRSVDMNMNTSRSIELLMPQQSKARHGGSFGGDTNGDDALPIDDDDYWMATYRSSGDCGSARMIIDAADTAARMTSMTLKDVDTADE